MNIYTKFDAECNIFRYKNDNILEVLRTHRVRHFLWSFQSPDVWKAYTKFQINQRKTVVELRYDITSSGQMKKNQLSKTNPFTRGSLIKIQIQDSQAIQYTFEVVNDTILKYITR